MHNSNDIMKKIFSRLKETINKNLAGFLFITSALFFFVISAAYDYFVYKSYRNKFIQEKKIIINNILNEKNKDFKQLEQYFIQNLKLPQLLIDNSEELKKLSSKKFPAFHNNFFYFIYNQKGDLKNFRSPERFSDAFFQDEHFISFSANLLQYKNEDDLLMWITPEGPVQLYFKTVKPKQIESEPIGYLLIGLIWDKNFRDYIEKNLNADVKLVSEKNVQDYEADFVQFFKSAFDSEKIALIVKLKDSYQIDYALFALKYASIALIFFIVVLFVSFYERKKIYAPLKIILESINNKSFKQSSLFENTNEIITNLALSVEKLLLEFHELILSEKNNQTSILNYENRLRNTIEELELKKAQLNKITKIIEEDFTNFKLNAISQKNAEQKIKTFFEDAPVSYLILDSYGTILEFNKRWQGYVQYEDKEIRNSRLSNFLTSISAEHFDNSLKVFSELNYLYCDLEIVSKKGSILEAKFFGRAQKENGELRIYSIIVDITETRNAIKKLEEKERYLSDIIKNAPEAILIFDKNGIIIDANPEAENLLNMSKSSLIGLSYDSPIWNYKDINNYPIDKTQTPFYICKNECQPIKDIFISIVNDKGKKLCLKIRAVPLFNSNRIFNGALISMIDMTDKILNEIELKKKNKQLQYLLENSNKMIRILSHDLKSPYVGILGLTEILANEAENFDYDNIKRLSSELHVTLKKQYKLIDNLLNWARMKAGQIDFNKKEIDISELIKETINYYNLNLKQKNISVNLHIEDKSTAYIDENVTLLVINNILSNAIKYSPKNKSINIFVKNNDNFLQISIQDQGIGMSPNKIQELLNNEFVTSEPGLNKEKGTGIGFSIARQFVKELGGEIQIQSEINKGTTVLIALPKRKTKNLISQQ